MGDIVVLEIENAQFECSRSDLSRKSAYFKVMFEDNSIERKETKKIELKVI